MKNSIIKIIGAKEHNLKNVDLQIPKYKLIVFTGVSGSGKSSLAFNTIYTEGRRRYIESLSSYARQFLGNTEKSQVDKIEGLSPTIAIDQKTRSHNPRSTVGTVTEIYDYLRLLYARIGTPYCVNCNIQISNITIKQILENIQSGLSEGDKILILAPVARNKKGTFKDTFQKLLKNHFLRVRVDGQVLSLDEEINLDKNIKHNIEIVIDRIIYRNHIETLSRMHDAIEIALEYGNKLVGIEITNIKKEFLFSANYSCKNCDFKISYLEPRLFSFNAPIGACETCKGLGVSLEIDPNVLMPNKKLTIDQGGILYFKNTINTDNWEWQKFKILLNHYNISTIKPIEKFSKEELEIILRGSKERIPIKLISSSGINYQNFNFVEGIGSLIERRYALTASERNRTYYRKFLLETKCRTCQGKRLKAEALAVKLNKISIYEFCNLPINEAIKHILNLKLNETQQKIADLVLQEILNRLSFLNQVGLKYLTLNRSAQTLSGGESQRIRLATQIGSQLSGVIYILDEPSIGLHQKDNQQLLKTLQNLKDLGNTVIVVEHDEETIRAADWIVDLGPGAGTQGGIVIYNGPQNKLKDNEKSVTAAFLNNDQQIFIPKIRRGGNGQVIKITGANENNLKNIDVKIPLNKFVVITGVSGSGKSTLMNLILAKALKNHFSKDTYVKPGKFKKITGMDHLKQAIVISQDPIGKTPRSVPATYSSVFDDIRLLFSEAPESKMRGYTKSRFSFNVPGGRCEHCQGGGEIKINMQFLPNVTVKCEVCNGSRFNEETLLVKFKNKNINNVLNMTVAEALEFFAKQSIIKHKLQTLFDVGLGYLKLGQPTTQLSGGEAQRLKLSSFLLKKITTDALFIMDEPTTGLHPLDIKKILEVINRIIDYGNTVIIIEHNLDVIKTADYIIDLGPNGGNEGGQVICTGTPEQIANHEFSYTAKYIKEILNEKSK